MRTARTRWRAPRKMMMGWMKVALDGLAPRTYSLLEENDGWEMNYVPPPEIPVP